MPLQFLALVLIRHPDYQWQYVYYFLPQIVLRLLIMPFVFYQPRRRLATIIVTMATAYTFLQALYLLIIRRPLGWEATGALHHPRHNRFSELKIFAFVYFLLIVVGTTAFAILNESFGRQTAYLLQALFFFSLSSQIVHLIYIFAYGEGKQRSGIPRQSAVVLGVVAIVGAGIIGAAYFMHAKYDFYAGGAGRRGLISHTSAGVSAYTEASQVSRP